jgi:methyltransferase
MKDTVLFFVFFCMLVLQRLIELRVAKKNEKWMKAQGAIEFGTRHYQLIVWMHGLFFISFIIEKLTFNRGVSPIWPYLLVFFLFVQLVRVWAILSLGKYWNTKILVLPNAEVVKKGPYRYIKHPNYFVVIMELAVVPLLFEAYVTAVLFSLLNIMILSIRIPEEENALKKLTEYETRFSENNRFLPKFVK